MLLFTTIKEKQKQKKKSTAAYVPEDEIEIMKRGRKRGRESKEVRETDVV